jgi:hypothetical protein
MEAPYHGKTTHRKKKTHPTEKKPTTPQPASHPQHKTTTNQPIKTTHPALVIVHKLRIKPHQDTLYAATPRRHTIIRTWRKTNIALDIMALALNVLAVPLGIPAWALDVPPIVLDIMAGVHGRVVVMGR